ncbi:MAG TPA: glycosyltransferase family 4 protein [Arenibaculum sp.]|nr:glycosyltransferase family 4 protein [Arenibaculum sp.]
MPRPTCLLVTSIFPPIAGGSALVYHNIARCAEGSVMVLGPRRNYQDGRELAGWRDFDRDQPYPVRRLDLLRPPQVEAKGPWHSAWLMVTTDLPLKLRVLAEIVRIARLEKIRVLCIGELDSGSWLGPFVRHLFGWRIVNYVHGEEITAASAYRSFGRHKKRYLARADAVIAVSDFTRRQLMERMQVDADRIELIPNGIDTSRFSPGVRDPALVARYGLAGKTVLLGVGRLIERKGFDRAITALALLRHARPDLCYLIVGTGPYRDRLERIAGEAGVRERVVFAGSVPDPLLPAHYRLADLFVLPNRELPDGDTEGFGLVYLEANASGKPVVAGRAGGVAEVVLDGINGLAVDGGDAHAVAAAVDRLLSDRDLYDRLTRNALQLAAQADWRSRADRFRRLSRRLVESPEP